MAWKEKVGIDDVINEVISLDVDINDNDFKEWVVIIYGLYNDTVSANKIKKGTGFTMKEVYYIIDNCWEKGYIKSYKWDMDF